MMNCQQEAASAPPEVACNSSDCEHSPIVAVIGKTGDLIPLCATHRPKVPEELLAAWLFEENLMLPDVSVGIVREVCQKAVLEHIQRCLILLAPLAATLDSWEDREEDERVAAEAYSALHAVEKDWLRRLGKPGDGPANGSAGAGEPRG